LSQDHHDWPVIDAVSDTTLRHETPVPPMWDNPSPTGSTSGTQPANMSKIPIRKMIRRLNVVPRCSFIASDFLPRFSQYQSIVQEGAFPFA